jgi:Glycosyl hydrolase family 12
MRRLASALIASLVWAACSADITSATIQVDSDQADQITFVRVEIRDAQDQLTGDQFDFPRTRYGVPFSFGLKQRTAAQSRAIVKATAFAADDTMLAQAKLAVKFVQGETIQRTLRLRAACQGIACAAGFSCNDAADGCEDIWLGKNASGPTTGDDTPAADGGSITSGADAQPAAADAGAAQGGKPRIDHDAGAGANAGTAGAGGRGANAGAGHAAAAAGGTGATGGAGTAADSGGVGAVAGNSGSEAGSSGDSGSGVLSAADSWALVTHDGRSYAVHNNVYDPKAGQTIRYQSTSFTVEQLTGDNPTGVANPSVFIGSIYNRTSLDSHLPMRVSALQHVALSFNHNGGDSVAGTYAVLASIWFSLNADGDTELPTGGYLSVWPYAKPEQLPDGTLAAPAVTVTGVPGSWDVWVGTSGDRPSVTYVRTQASSSFDADVNLFIRDALSRPGAIQSSWYVTSVAAGFDIRNGGVGLQMRGVSASVQ